MALSGNPVQVSKGDLVFAWVIVLIYAAPAFWPLVNSTPFLLPGLRGLSKPEIGFPILMCAVVSVLQITVPGWRRSDKLIFASGFQFAVFLGSSFYVANSGFMGAVVLSGMLARLAIGSTKPQTVA